MSQNDLPIPGVVFPEPINWLQKIANGVFVNNDGDNIYPGLTVSTPRGVGVVKSLAWSRESVRTPSALVQVGALTLGFSLRDLTPV